MWNDPMGYLFFLDSPYQKQSQKAMDYQSMEMMASFINL